MNRLPDLVRVLAHRAVRTEQRIAAINRRLSDRQKAIARLERVAEGHGNQARALRNRAGHVVDAMQIAEGAAEAAAILGNRKAMTELTRTLAGEIDELLGERRGEVGRLARLKARASHLERLVTRERRRLVRRQQRRALP